MKDLVYTPISKTYKKKGDPDSRKDFEEQEKLTKQGNTWMWDADRNLAKKMQGRMGGHKAANDFGRPAAKRKKT